MGTIWIEKCGGECVFVCGLAWLVHGEGFLLYIGWLNCRGGVSHISLFVFSLLGRFFFLFFFFSLFHLSALYFGPGGACSCLSFAISLIIRTAFLLSLPCRPSPMFFR